MALAILSKGKELISAVRASEKCGYSSDYIGQLCRAKKVEATLVGRTWFVAEDSILKHRDDFQIHSSRYLSKRRANEIFD